jgi:uncharacterized protein YjiS (DUF1127 family)
METYITRWRRLVRSQIRLWRERAQGRRELSRLCADHFRTEFDLRDMGISRADARSEAGKPFWRG